MKIEEMRASTDRVYAVGTIIIDERFWVCRCKKKYIHSRLVVVCGKCLEHAEDMPNAHATEITVENLHSNSNVRLAQVLGYEFEDTT